MKCYRTELISEKLVYWYGPKNLPTNIQYKSLTIFFVLSEHLFKKKLFYCFFFVKIMRKRLFCNMLDFFIPFWKNFSLPENEESTPFFVNLIGIILVLGHKSWKGPNLFSNSLHHTSTLNLKLCLNESQSCL